ncbi:hypothetical protein BZA05DRAFT_445177 [Tricharina praecox]|uniref:uncharacterized protein n=1 Tax=Tricharina praecox TaxID=43433 RepID=UPI00221F05A4|nr:uncharacterized protein BZA05DRAFT_445177 [Tricharina praecox]KAI5852015.1 hypothetical protein BZA05DRAFT_445177 [Tricharina praecox]
MVSIRSLLAIALAAAAAQVYASPIALADHTHLSIFDYASPPSSLSSPQGSGGGCSEILQRRAWQSLSASEKRAYLDAELCLMWQIPAQSGLAATVSRYDDLIKAHQLQSGVVHGDGWFLPFHRLHMYAHEKLLREECGYEGAQPYWDEEADAGRFTQAEIFDTELGFGGTGRVGDRCITDGPFANYTLHTGPGYQNTDHCITRTISDLESRNSATQFVEECLALPTFARAWPCIESRPHAGGHAGVGGEMMNPISSPGDPLFYLHHTFLDRVWWRWQERDLPARLEDIAGYTTQTRPRSGWVNATLDDELNMYGIIPNATVREVMDIKGGLCFEYV